MDDTQDQPTGTLEERFAALRAQAAEQGSEISLSLTVGGVRIKEIYQIWKTLPDDASLEDQITQSEQMLSDVRVRAATEATKRMIESENIADMAIEIVRRRQAEYAIAVKALRQAFELNGRPEDGDLIQQVVGEVAAMTRDEPLPEHLAQVIADAYREAQDAPDLPPAQDAEQG